MRLILLDQHAHLSSPIHRLPATLKLVAAIALILSIVGLPRQQHLYLLVVAGFLVAVAALTRIPVSFLLRRLLLLEPFVLGVALLALFQPGGWHLFLILLAKCTLCLLTMILLSNTTPFSDLLGILRRLRIPTLLITTLALMYRYLFVLVDETQRMRRARLSRSFVADRSRAWHGLATLIGQLFVRASERAERIYAAMCARGWQ